MSKKALGIVSLLLLASFVLGGPGMALTTKTFSVVVLGKEKTVFADNKEILGVLDVNYKVTKNATITSTAEGVILSYKGNIIEGKIKLKAANAVLDGAIKDQRSVDIRYLLSKNKKISESIFSGSKIIGSEIVKKDKKTASVLYYFRSGSVIESQK